ncbi:MAG: pyridoxamine 5'-phosphate oxidase family protein [Spirochaetaceae bacterium]|jgi:nitroimidazol reductase NimA-like FMN-containing flavoprotein (pyridoxamine 5'-phosphate oxidase superfamily)|nr:pyridoxamine 5'-phosphate oxidase family protein [Spirochaetaceae bacterium]
MRRKDREISREAAEAVVDACAYAVLSTANPDGSPYGVPVSIVRDGAWLYFHCAQEGQKVDNMRAMNQVCVTCTGNIQLLEERFSLAYESAVVFGTAQEVLEESEKIRGLRLICLRYAPGNMDAFDGAIRRSLGRTGVWKIHIDRITGKRRDPQTS